MNCSECRELLVAYVEDLLDTGQRTPVEEHLAACAGCRDHAAQVQAIHSRLISNGEKFTSCDLENPVMDAISRRRAFELRRNNERKQPSNLWRIIMKNRLLQLATAAAIIVAAVAALHFFGGAGTKPCLAWDCIIRPIIDARTAEFDIVIGDEGAAPVIHDMVMGSRIRRTLEGIPEASIIDLSSSRILTLIHDAKIASIVELKGLPNMPDYMDVLRNLVAKIEQDPNFTIGDIGEQDVEGQVLYGVRAASPKHDLTIWVDPATALPVRIEQQEGQIKTTCKNMVFDVPMDESLFSMDVPDGYTLQQTQLSIEANEEDFIEMLRIQGEVLGGGVFPDDVSVDYFVKQAPAIGVKLGSLGLSQEEQKQIGEKLAQGLMFIRFFKGEGNWHYGGKSVKFDDADTAIFWYRPKDSPAWRVIYGDLSVKDVAAEDLPSSQ